MRCKRSSIYSMSEPQKARRKVLRNSKKKKKERKQQDKSIETKRNFIWRGELLKPNTS